MNLIPWGIGKAPGAGGGVTVNTIVSEIEVELVDETIDVELVDETIDVELLDGTIEICED